MQRGESFVQKLYVFGLMLSFCVTLLGISILKVRHNPTPPDPATASSVVQKLRVLVNLNQ